MKSGRSQLEFELRSPQECRSLRRTKKPTAARGWFEKMRQVVEGAVERPATQVSETPDLPRG
jgi:hypothetical protein